MKHEQERAQLICRMLMGGNASARAQAVEAVERACEAEAELQAAQERDAKLTEEQYREAHTQGFDDGLESVWTEPVCSVCGSNHDRDESAACEGCEVVSFREWVAAQRTEEPIPPDDR